MNNNSIDQQFVEFIVRSLVSKPDAVKVERRIDEKGVLLELTVDPEDLGREIGKRAATAQSLRTLLRALGTKNDARYNLKIIDNGDGGQFASVPTNTATDDAAATVSSSDDTSDDTQSQTTYDEDDDARDDGSDRLRQARKELEELDDLDV